MGVAVVAVAVFLVNLPFGFWRAGAARFSWRWFLAVHAPVPVVVGLRIASGLGWQLFTIPILLGAFFAGQLAGGRLHDTWARRR